MTDKELLELAAKAVGMEHCANVFGMFLLGEEDRYWNPLTDDGDALRLAVELRLKISHNHFGVFVDYNGFTNIEVTEQITQHRNDRNQATRRAIVRAAAEIGKEMK